MKLFLEAIGLISVPFEKKHVVVVCGEPRILAEIKMCLMEYFDVTIAASGIAAAAALETYKVAAAVIYIGKEREAAFEKFAVISAFIKTKNIPVIFLAEADNADDEIAAFAGGAADFAVRRHGAADALIRRINLRVRACENEKWLLGGESAAHSRDVSPEEELSGKTILIADDIALNKEIISGMLSGVEGLNIEFAGTGRESVEKFAENPRKYSLILMDIMMPEMDGLEATKIIRSLNCENSREVAIVALSASVEEGEIASCLEAGMNDFIEKPMAYDRLIEIISKYCLR